MIVRIESGLQKLVAQVAPGHKDQHLQLRLIRSHRKALRYAGGFGILVVSGLRRLDCAGAG